MVFGVIGAIVAATISMNAFERRREVATLRALGMRGRAVVAMFSVEALLMAAGAVMVGLVGSGSSAWIVNRAGLSWMAQQQAPMLVELEAGPMLMAAVTAMAVALVAALVAALAPALKTARADVAEGLAR